MHVATSHIRQYGPRSAVLNLSYLMELPGEFKKKKILMSAPTIPNSVVIGPGEAWTLGFLKTPG